MKRLAFLFTFVIGLAGAAYAESDFSFLDAARRALKISDRQQVQFWIARHLAASRFVADEDVLELLRQLRLEPKGFIPQSWPPAVHRWFIERGRIMWTADSPYIHDDQLRFEVASAATETYFATLTAAPEIQAWYGLEEGLSTARELLIAGASKPAPTLAFGRRISGEKKSQPSAVVRIFTLRALHHASLDFKDADGDGQPEVFARLTWLVSNGFRQTLRIYKIRPGDQLELWKTLDAPTGFFLPVDPAEDAQPVAAEGVSEAEQAALLD